MPIPIDKIKNVKQVKRGTRIGADDEILQDVVSLINEFPKRVTLTGLAQTLQLRGKYLDITESNLRSRIRRRLDILSETIDRKTGEPALKRKSELRIDAFGETDGSVRYIWYLPQYQDDVQGEVMPFDDFRLLLDLANQPEYIKTVFDEWHPTESGADIEGWKVSFWQYIRDRIKNDSIWLQYIAAELGEEQDAVMDKRVIRRFSAIIEEIWSVLE